MPLSPAERQLRARLAAQTRWAQATPAERRQGTQAARDALAAQFAAAPNPEAARKAHQTRMTLAAARKRSAA
jgi:hypothetical protein